MAQGGDEQQTAQATRLRLFLSYTRADIDRARPIIAFLERAGFDVWWDGLLEGGDHYLPATEAALEAADCVVVLWSKLSIDSNWVRDEAQGGRERGRLIPVSLDGTMAPLGFRQIQSIDLSGWNGTEDAPELDRIATAVHRVINGSASMPVSRPAIVAAPGVTGISRRSLMLSFTGLALGASAVGAWQFGFFGGATDGDAVMALAVLRFENLTGDDAQTWFSDGLSNELRQVLSRNPRLRVSAPTSSRGIDGEDDFAIARALGVGTILRGSVQRADETLRILAELVEVEGGFVRWSQSYDRAFDDVLAVQAEIADEVALGLVIEVAGQSAAQRSLEEQDGIGGTDSVTAYESYLRGFALADLSAGLESDRAALVQFDAAIAADPSYAQAHAMRSTMFAALANATSEANQFGSLFEQSIASARRAIALEPKLARGHLALGFALNNGKLDPKAAEPYFQRAADLAPGDADTQGSVALFYAYGDRQAEAVMIMQRVLELDPINARAFRRASVVALLAREYSKAISFGERAIELNPNLASVNFFVGNAQLMRNDVKSAMAAFDAEPVAQFRLVGLAITHAKAGDMAAAQADFESLIAEYGDASLYQQAQILAQWGDTSAALATLARAKTKGDPGLLFARNDPLLDPLRGAREFDRLLLQITA